MKVSKKTIKVLAVMLIILICTVGCAKKTDSTGGTDTSQGTATGQRTEIIPTDSINDDDATSGEDFEPTAPTASTEPEESTKTENPENTTGSNNEPELYVLKGVWKFQDKLSIPEEIEEGAGTYFSYWVMSMLEFTSNGEVFDGGISFVGLLTEDWQDLGYGVEHVYSSEYGWDDEAYKTIDLGPYPQEINPYFYKWFIKNAEKVSD